MNEDMKLLIPRRLDDKAKFLWWDMDQAMLVSTFLMLGVLAEMVAAGFVTGLIAGYMYSRAKAGKHPDFAIHLMYWYLPSSLFKMNVIPPSHLTEFIG